MSLNFEYLEMSSFLFGNKGLIIVERVGVVNLPAGAISLASDFQHDRHLVTVSCERCPVIFI